MKRTAVVWSLLLTLVALLASACSLLPQDGPVHQIREPSDDRNPAVSFIPPGPQPGQSAEDVVQGYLLAMQATPANLSVARSFLTPQAAKRWSPDDGTVIYQYSSISRSGSRITTRLADAHRLDRRGGWRGGEPGSPVTLRLDMVRSGGEWRIQNPPNSLVVPAAFFRSQFVANDLYFYDQTRRALVPDQVYVPRGEQGPSDLVRSLLEGPSPTSAPVTTSAFTRDTALDLPVGISEAAVAEVPLNKAVLKLPPQRLTKAYRQLAATLGQIPGVSRVRITVDGVSVPLPDGRFDMRVEEGTAASGLPQSRLLVVRKGRVEQVDERGAYSPVAGPLGRAGFSLRSLARSGNGSSVTAVAGNGQAVYVAALTGRRDDSTVHTAYTGTNVGPPSANVFNETWLLDRTPNGARIVVIRGNRSTVVRIPGLRRAKLAGISASPDGTRLAAVADQSGPPRVLVANLIRKPNGTLDQPAAARRIPVLTPDLGRARSVAWYTGNDLAVLTGTSAMRLAFLNVDGSPGDGSPMTSQYFRGRATQVVTGPGVNQTTFIVADKNRLVPLTASWGWDTSVLTGVNAASY